MLLQKFCTQSTKFQARNFATDFYFFSQHLIFQSAYFCQTKYKYKNAIKSGEKNLKIQMEISDL